jgi:hypothetical protein
MKQNKIKAKNKANSKGMDISLSKSIKTAIEVVQRTIPNLEYAVYYFGDSLYEAACTIVFQTSIPRTAHRKIHAMINDVRGYSALTQFSAAVIILGIEVERIDFLTGPVAQDASLLQERKDKCLKLIDKINLIIDERIKLDKRLEHEKKCKPGSVPRPARRAKVIPTEAYNYVGHYI